MVPMGFQPREKSFNQRNVELYVNVWFENHTSYSADDAVSCDLSFQSALTLYCQT